MTEPTTLSRWQDPEDDGYPSDAYFRAVDKALTAAGITAWGWRDESWEYSFELDEGFTGDYSRLYVTWRVGDDSEPLSGNWEPLPGGICGWYWVPYSRDDQLTRGLRPGPGPGCARRAGRGRGGRRRAGEGR